MRLATKVQIVVYAYEILTIILGLLFIKILSRSSKYRILLVIIVLHKNLHTTMYFIFLIMF